MIKREIPDSITEYRILKGFEDSNFCDLCKFVWDKKYYNIYSDMMEDTYCLNCFYRGFNLSKDEKTKILKLSPMTEIDLMLNRFWETLQAFFIKNNLLVDEGKPIFRRHHYTIEIDRTKINLPFGFLIEWEPQSDKGNMILRCGYMTGDINFIKALVDFKESIISG